MGLLWLYGIADCGILTHLALNEPEEPGEFFGLRMRGGSWEDFFVFCWTPHHPNEQQEHGVGRSREVRGLLGGLESEDMSGAPSEMMNRTCVKRSVEG